MGSTLQGNFHPPMLLHGTPQHPGWGGVWDGWPDEDMRLQLRFTFALRVLCVTRVLRFTFYVLRFYSRKSVENQLKSKVSTVFGCLISGILQPNKKSRAQIEAWGLSLKPVEYENEAWRLRLKLGTCHGPQPPSFTATDLGQNHVVPPCIFHTKIRKYPRD
jgi:hypothetical protein